MTSLCSKRCDGLQELKNSAHDQDATLQESRHDDSPVSLYPLVKSKQDQEHWGRDQSAYDVRVCPSLLYAAPSQCEGKADNGGAN